MSVVTIQDLTRILMEASPEAVAQFLLAAERGLEAWSALSGKAVPVFSNIETPVKKVPVAKKANKKEVVAPSIPSGSGIPTADSYRLTTIDNSVCVARSLKPAGEDKRWKPSVYAEAQCGGKVADGSDLCAACVKKMEKFAESKTAKSGWNGRLTESPPDYTHMLGTAWAVKCKWIGDDGDSVSVSEAPEISTNNAVIPVSMSNVVEPESKPEENEAVVTMPPKKATAEAKKLEAAKAKEEAAAKKLAEAEAKKAAAEAKKLEAAKAKAAAKKPAASKKSATTVPEVKATTTSTPATVAGELLTVGTEFYWVNNGNVYEYSLVTEQQGDFVGRLRSDGTIDGDGEEVTAAESDSE
jgi:chemotaxis protein histidine kinase CheA